MRNVWLVSVLLLGLVACDSASSDAPDIPLAGEDIAAAEPDLGPADTSVEPDVPQEPEMQWVGCDGPVDLESIPERQFVVAPYLVDPHADRVTVQWEALDDGPAYLLWGPEGGINTCVCVTNPSRFEVVSEFVDGHDGWLYSVTLEGLAPGGRYEYDLVGAQVLVDDAMSLMAGIKTWKPFEGAAFDTPPQPGAEFSVVIYGDNQPFTFDHGLVAQGVRDMEPELVVHTGDIVHNGQFDQYRSFYFPMAADLVARVPHIYAAGNHEEDGDALPFDAYFPVRRHTVHGPDGEAIEPGPRSGWFDIGAARFFILDTQRSMDAGTSQLAWLDAALGETVHEHPEIVWLFMVWHRPTFSGSDSEWRTPREAIHDVLTHWKVDAVWNGHSHAYEHFLQDDIHYVVTGGGGAGLYSIDHHEFVDGENRVAGEVSHHFVHGIVGTESAGFRVVRASDFGDIDTFTIEAKDRSALRQ